MEPAEGLRINYSFAKSPFGELLIASASGGIVYAAFEKQRQRKTALKDLQEYFPKAALKKSIDPLHALVLSAMSHDPHAIQTIPLLVKGSDFQAQVWNNLLNIPFGTVINYKTIAEHIKKPKAVRAVGTAVGKNPVAFLIPCHRVTPSTGGVGRYHWGSARKAKMIAWEANFIL